MMRLARYILWGILALVVAGVGGVHVFRGPAELPESAIPPGWGAPFTLTDHRSQPITEAALAGHPSILFFGFTHCPEVCPTTLHETAGWLDELGEEGSRLKAFFITVDPERDTPEIMSSYVTNLSDRITGITGDLDGISALARSWRIFFQKVLLEGGGYTMDHTASIYLIRPDGSLQGAIAYGENPDVALEKLRQLAGAS